MNNQLLPLVSFIFLSNIIMAQNRAGDCLPCSATLELKTNSLLAHLSPSGSMAFQLNDITNHLSFSEESSLWFTTYDPSGNAKIAAEIAEREGHDFYPGPLDELTGRTHKDTCKNWDRFYVMRRPIITNFNTSYIACLDSGHSIPIDSIPLALLTWPAKGNPHFHKLMDYTLPNTSAGLAPFWDENADGVYNPEDGDFPTISIQGCEPSQRIEALHMVPDEFAFWIFNDAGSIHSNSEGALLSIEVHGLAFAYDVEGPLQNTVFQQYKMINRSTETFINSYFNYNLNPAIGCSSDDYFGCKPENDLVYFYNESQYDGGEDCTCADESQSWCDEIPMFGIDILQGGLSPKLISEDTEGNIVLENPFLGQSFDTLVEEKLSGLSYFLEGPILDSLLVGLETPTKSREYLHLSESKFTDGTRITKDGIGYNPGSEDFTNFAFLGDPDSDGWSMCLANQNINSASPVLSSGPYVLPPDAFTTVLLSSFYVSEVNHPCPSLTTLLTSEKAVESVYETCFQIERDEPFMHEINTDLANISIYPNPYDIRLSSNVSTEKQVYIRNIPQGAEIRIYSLDGKFIKQLETNHNAYIHDNICEVAWNLQNFAGRDIAPGVYLIHVNDQKTGQHKTLKWFGNM